jgi:ParB/RepB/Spo0J family partition protein
MNLEVTSSSTLVSIPIKAIIESKTNARRSFPREALEELAESISRHGVLQPISVRPKSSSGQYEIICGERRWRASQLAYLSQIPCLVREILSDEEVKIIQWIENLQREDLTPIEEAQGYLDLMQALGVTVEDISLKVGKSKSHIRRMITLAQLPKQLKAAVGDQSVKLSTALLFARIRDRQMREEAVKHFFDKKSGDFNANHGAIARELVRALTLDLGQAPFDIKNPDLLPAAGSCTLCPKRSGNDPDLFGDVGGNLCTDPKCYQRKLDALWTVTKQRAKEANQRVLTDAEAAVVFDNRYCPGELGPNSEQEWLDLDREIWISGKRQLCRKLLGRDHPQPVIARAADGTIHELLRKDEALSWAKEKKLAWAMESNNCRSENCLPVAERERLREQTRKERVRKTRVWLVAEAVSERLSDRISAEVWDNAEFWKQMLATLLTKSYTDEIRLLVNSRGWKEKKVFPGESFKKQLKGSSTSAELRTIFWQLFLLSGSAHSYAPANHGQNFAKLLGMDAGKIQKQAEKLVPKQKAGKKR